jgi:hypothetical protein
MARQMVLDVSSALLRIASPAVRPIAAPLLSVREREAIAAAAAALTSVGITMKQVGNSD